MHKVNILFLALVILLTAFLQVTFADALKIWKIKPDLLLIVVIFFAFNGGTRLGIKAGLLAGLLKDAFTSGPMACWSVTFALVGFFVGYYKNRLYRDSLYTQVFIALACFLASYLFYYSFADVFNKMPPFGESLFCLIIPASIYTAIFTPIIFIILDKVWPRKKAL